MRENSLAKRYALGFIKSIQDEEEYTQVKRELEEFSLLLKKDDDFKTGMETLLFSKKQKKELVDSVAQKAGFGEKTFNFLHILLEENRFGIFDTIIPLLEDLWFEKNDIQKLTVFSAVEMNEKLEKKLVQNLEKSFGKKVVLEKAIDKSLIAGIKIQQGSVFYDFSINGNLKKLKDALITEASVDFASGQEH